MDKEIGIKIMDCVKRVSKEYIDEVLENGEIDVYKRMSKEEIVEDFVLWIKEGGSS